MLEMTAILFDGAHTAEGKLSDLRSSRDDPWLSEVSLIEHDANGRYSVKAKGPVDDDEHAGKGAAIGGLTGLLVGAIGGPFGLVFWSGLGALTGGAIGASKDSSFQPLVDELKAWLGPDASLLLLVGETSTLNDFVSVVGASNDAVLREALTSEQAKELSEAAG